MKQHFRFLILFLLAFTVSNCGDRDRTTAASRPLRTEVFNKETVYSVLSGDEVPADFEGQSGHAGAASQEGRPIFIIQFSSLGGGAAYGAKKGKGSYIVHNGKAGRSYDAMGDFSLSPDGSRLAYGARKGKRWVMVVDGREGRPYDEVGIPVFSIDGRHVAYEARKGERWCFVVDDRESSWCESYYEKPVFDRDSKRLLRIENTKDVWLKRFIISDLSFSRETVIELRGRLVVFSPDGCRIAFAEELPEGKRLAVFSYERPEDIKRSGFYDDLSYISFGEDSRLIAYAAIKGKKRFLVFNGKEAELPQGDLISLPVINSGNGAVGIFMGREGAIALYEFFFEPLSVRIKKHRVFESASDLVYSKDGKQYSYLARRGNRIFAVVNNRETEAFDMIVSPMFSPDGRFFVFRAREKGDRFMVVVDAATARTVKRHDAYERVFEPCFTSDGRSIAYGVKDGARLVWKVERLGSGKGITRNK